MPDRYHTPFPRFLLFAILFFCTTSPSYGDIPLTKAAEFEFFGPGEIALGSDHVAYVISAFGGSNLSVVHIMDGSAMTVATSNTEIPGRPGEKFTGFEKISISEGRLAFIGIGSPLNKSGDNYEGVFTFHIASRSLLKRVDIDESAPGTNPPEPFGDFRDLRMDGDRLVFSTQKSFTRPARNGVYALTLGSLPQRIADTSTRAVADNIVGTTAYFESFGDVAFEGKKVAFVVHTFKSSPGTAGEALYLWNDGILKKITDRDDVYSPLDREMTGYSDLTLDAGVLGYRASNGSVDPIYAGYFLFDTVVGGRITVYDTSTVFSPADQTIGFSDFVLGKNRSLAGETVIAGGPGGLYLGIDGPAETHPLIAHGQMIDGATFTNFRTSRSMREGSRFAFSAVNARLEYAIFVGDLTSLMPPPPNLFIREMIIQQGVTGIDKLLVQRPTLVQIRPGRSADNGPLSSKTLLRGVTGLLHVLTEGGLEIEDSPFQPTGLPLDELLDAGNTSDRWMLLRGTGEKNQYAPRDWLIGNDTLNFIIPELPYVGEYRFWAEINPDRTIHESNYEDNRYHEFDPIALKAVGTTQLEILVSRFYRLGLDSGPPEPEILLNCAEFLKLAYPLEAGDVKVVPTSLVIAHSPGTSAYVFPELAFHRALSAAYTGDRADVSLSIGPPGSTRTLREYALGIDSLGLTVAPDASLVEAVPVFLESTVAHEIGHLFDLGDTYEDGNEQPVNPRICPNRCTASGNRLVPGGFSWFNGRFMGIRDPNEVEFMGSGANDSTWSDLATWNHLLSRFEIDGSKIEPPRRFTPHNGPEPQVAVIAGSIQVASSSHSGLIVPIVLLPSTSAEISVQPTPGPYHLRFLDDSETILYDWSFDAPRNLDSPVGFDAFGSFGFSIPFPVGTKYVDLDFNDENLARSAVTPTAPTVSLNYPVGNEALSGEVEISWNGTDLDGDFLKYNVLLHSEEETIVLATGLEESLLIWDTRQHNGSSNARIEVLASDGILTGSDVSGMITIVGGDYPRPTITSPNEGAQFAEGESILAAATYFDPAGRDATYQWSLVGGSEIGLGNFIRLDDLPVGSHTLRVVASAQGDQGVAEVQFSVYPDSDGDRMADDWEVDLGIEVGLDDSGRDNDEDGLLNGDEWRAETSPNLKDTDGDSFSDGEEWSVGSDPTDLSESPLTIAVELADTNGDGRIDGQDVLAFQEGWRQVDTSSVNAGRADLDRNGSVDQRDGIRLVEVFHRGPNAPPSTPTPTVTETVQPTATSTLIPSHTPTLFTPTPSIPTLTPTSTSVASLTVTPTPTPTETPTGTAIHGIFQEGDGSLDFSVFPDGSAVNGVITQSFTPGTYLIDQFASVGVRFRSTRFGSADLNGIGAGVIGGPDNNLVQGMRNAPPLGLDGRTVWEIVFDEPVRRAGIRRRGFVNYALGSALTNFYDADSNLIVSIETAQDLTFVSHQLSDGSPGIKRIEITSTDPHAAGAGGADDLVFSQVGSLSIPVNLRYQTTN